PKLSIFLNKGVTTSIQLLYDASLNIAKHTPGSVVRHCPDAALRAGNRVLGKSMKKKLNKLKMRNTRNTMRSGNSQAAIDIESSWTGSDPGKARIRADRPRYESPASLNNKSRKTANNNNTITNWTANAMATESGNAELGIGQQIVCHMRCYKPSSGSPTLP